MPQWRHRGSVNTAPGYAPKILKTAAANLVAYWPMWEASGSTSEDISGNGYNGAYTGVTLGEAGIEGRTCPLFDGANDYNNVYSAGLAGAFSEAAGTLMIWAKVAGSSVWTDAATRVVAVFLVDANNRVVIYKSATDGQVILLYHAGGTQTIVSNTGNSATGWLSFALTWSVSGDAVIGYRSGVKIGATQTGLGTWSGALATTGCLVGAYPTAPSLVWSGPLAHCALWDTPLSGPQISYLSKP